MAGFCQNVGICAVRDTIDGALDANFGVNGKLPQVFVLNAINVASSIALLPNGKFLLAGTCSDLADNDFCLLRFNADGSLDSTFGTFGGGGASVTPIGSGDDRAQAMLTQPDGKIVVAGTCSNGIDSDFCAARYLPNGALDATFGVSGKVITVVGSGYSEARAAALQADGKLLIAAQCLTGSKNDFCTLRYNANGTLDLNFGTNGKLVISVGIGNDVLTSLVLQGDGKLILAGQCAVSGQLDFAPRATPLRVRSTRRSAPAANSSPPSVSACGMTLPQ